MGETTHWTGRAMAKVTGVAISTVQKIWRPHGLAPHRLRTFKLSRDPQFAGKVRDVVGLYIDPPAHAVVLSVDEKSQIQVLDRTQPGLPMKKGRAGTMTHDYIRNGTTTPFAALNVLDGTVIGQCMQRHRHQEFQRFLNTIEPKVPAGKLVHVILDNYASHKHPKVRAWLARHPRWTFHFTPTSASRLDAVEGFFAKLTNRRLKRGMFHSLVDLQAAINRYLTEHNHNPKPFVWTADPDTIIAAARRGYQVLDSIHWRPIPPAPNVSRVRSDGASTKTIRDGSTRGGPSFRPIAAPASMCSIAQETGSASSIENGEWDAASEQGLRGSESYLSRGGIGGGKAERPG